MRTHAICSALVILLLSTHHLSNAFETCSPKSGGGICPDGNTCCSISALQSSSHTTTRNNPSGCIPNDMGSPGICCTPDDVDARKNTGCPPKYQCTALIDPDAQTFRPICERDESINPNHIDPLVRIVPRYKLCSPPKDTLTTVHGKAILKNSAQIVHKSEKIGEIAYYSSHGPILSPSLTSYSSIEAALVVVHGQSRNADDYFCSGYEAAKLQTIYPTDNVVVIAPRFLEWSDGNVTLSSGGEALRWGVGDSSKKKDRAGVWRFGADAIHPSEAKKISSFDALDAVVLSLSNTTQFPNVKLVSVAGHSSGGQMVHRWALLSDIGPFEHNENDDARISRNLNQESTRRPHIRALVMNPSSYAYLDGQRYINGTFQYPTENVQRSCSQYNEWEYGLGAGGPTDVRYKQRAMKKAEGIDKIINRYATRDVVYLAGRQDRCPTTDRDDWCYSHGLETTCMDMIQGQNRLERSRNYFHFLINYYGREVHKRMLVRNVGHDHSLMFTSREGLDACFS